MTKKYLVITHSGPEDPGRATTAFKVAKNLVDKGEDVSIFLLNNAVYLMIDESQEHIQAPGSPPFEDYFLFLTMTKKIPIYIGEFCSIGRGLRDEKGNPKVKFSYGEIAGSDKLTELIVEADKILSI